MGSLQEILPSSRWIAACKMYMYSCLTEPIDQLSHRFTIFYTLVLFSTCNLYTKAIKALYLLIFVLWYFKNYYKFIYNFILVCFNSQVLVIIHFNLLVQKKWKLVFDELKEWWNKRSSLSKIPELYSKFISLKNQILHVFSGFVMRPDWWIKEFTPFYFGYSLTRQNTVYFY